MASNLPTVLIVDDDEANLDVLERILRGAYHVIRATDGDEALALFEANGADVVITDQRMPKMSGTQFLAQTLDINPRAVKIILSAFTDTADILSAINVSRINHYLVKPITRDKLLDTIKTALELVPQAAKYGI